MKSPENPHSGLRFLTSLLAAVATIASVSLAAAPLLAAGEKSQVAKPGAVAKPTLVFFMNPAGRPCQTQDEILKESRGKWEPLTTLRYVRTDVPADRDVFYRYGVRALPSLILVGAEGQEIHRYSPGIQSAESVISGIPGGAGR